MRSRSEPEGQTLRGKTAVFSFTYPLVDLVACCFVCTEPLGLCCGSTSLHRTNLSAPQSSVTLKSRNLAPSDDLLSSYLTDSFERLPQLKKTGLARRQPHIALTMCVGTWHAKAKHNH